MAEKFDPVVSFRVIFVGYIIDTRTMRVYRLARKSYKPQPCTDFPTTGIALSWHSYQRRWELSLHLVAAPPVRPYGCYTRKTSGFQKIVASAPHLYTPRGVPRFVSNQENALWFTVAYEELWSRPIGILVPREPTASVLSETSYGGIGGWREDFGILWHITHQELLDHSFPMREINASGEATRDAAGSDMLHISVLKYVGIIINIWLVISLIQADRDRLGGYVLRIQVDNMSTLSWLRHAAQAW